MIISTKFDGDRHITTIQARIIYYDVVPAQVVVIADKRDRTSLTLEFWTASKDVIEPPSRYIMPNVSADNLIAQWTKDSPDMSERGETFVFGEPQQRREILISRTDLKSALLIADNFLRSVSK
jgi:hypothetical protein